MDNFSLQGILDPMPGLDPEFRYPVGYFPSDDRVTDPAALEKFSEVMRPFVIRFESGSVDVDPHVPVCVKHLQSVGEDNLRSALRYLELDGPPDDSMKATYAMEDLLAYGCRLSDAGHHGLALKTLDSLPKPFRETPRVLEHLIQSHKALGSCEQALACADLLEATNRDNSDYRARLSRITRAELLVLLGRLDEAGTFLDKHRTELREFYSYLGVRSALALRHGEQQLAESLILRAGRADDYHAYKLIWSPALRPLADFIRRELLTADGEPMLHHWNSESIRLAHRIQGEMLRGNVERALALCEGILESRIFDWSCTHEVFLAMAGTGQLATTKRWTHHLPGHSDDAESIPVFVRTVLALFEAEAPEEADWLPTLISTGTNENIARAFQKLAIDSRGESADGLSFDLELRLAEVAGKWAEQGRDLWMLTLDTAQQFRLFRMKEPRRKRPREAGSPSYDPREEFPIMETHTLDKAEASSWLEQKLRANEGFRVEMYSRNPFRLDLNGWGLLRAFTEEDLQDCPHLKDNWRIAATDPNFYFSNGTLSSFGMTTPFETRLYHAMFNYFDQRRPEKGAID
jgi:hypothetical protein